jgi:hypothetical protein
MDGQIASYWDSIKNNGTYRNSPPPDLLHKSSLFMREALSFKRAVIFSVLNTQQTQIKSPAQLVSQQV